LADTLNNQSTELNDEFVVSVVVPVYNEEEGIDALFDRVIKVLNGLGEQFEIVCVDDGSSDSSAKIIRRWIERHQEIRLISLTRNFGKERAMAAGLDYAIGQVVIPIDADLQDPPELIPEMLNKWREGFEMVIAARNNRPGDTLVKRRSADYFYRIMNRLSEVPLPRNAGDFRLMDRKVVDTLRNLPERTRFHKGLFAWLGFKTCLLEFDRPERVDGESKWNYWRLWNYAIGGIFSFSAAPLKVWTYIGTLSAITGFVYATYIIVRTLIFGIDVPGYASLLVLMLFLNGLSMIGIGVVGEYVGRIFEEVKRRPIYLVNSVEGGNGPTTVQAPVPIVRGPGDHSL